MPSRTRTYELAAGVVDDELRLEFGNLAARNAHYDRIP